ncbi:MAG: flagellar biosynthetic protein FliR [Thermotoga sp.]|nr:MAG: flagellar biosynthetic protein FliR [Thermotoga sp.]
MIFHLVGSNPTLSASIEMDFTWQFVHQGIYLWSLIITRIVGMFIFSPLFGASIVPATARVGLAFFISVIVYSTLSPYYTIGISTPILSILISLMFNFLIGIIMGFTATLIFMGIQFAGEVYGIQIGFGMVNVMDPQSQTQISILSQFSFYLAMLVFIVVRGDLLLIDALVNSFKVIPPTVSSTSLNFVNVLIEKTGDVFIVGMEIGFPIIMFLLLTSFILGILSRLVPQMNVFMIGMPLKVALGLIMFLLLIPFWIDFFTKLFGNMYDSLMQLLVNF